MLPKLKQIDGYWKACWTDANRRRRFKSFGAIDKVTRQDAEQQLAKLIVTHTANPTSRDADRAPTLEGFLTYYFTERTDLDRLTILLHRSTSAYLLRFLPATTRLDKVTREQAARFRTFLAGQTYKRAKGDDAKEYTLSTATIRKHIGTAKLMFKWAHDRDLCPINPFDRVKLGKAIAQRDWVYVDAETMTRILDACPTQSWRTAFMLARHAGLRANEIRRAEIRWIDHGVPQINVEPEERPDGTQEETQKQTYRSVPLSPAVYEHVRISCELATVGQKLLCPNLAADVTHGAEDILARAGLHWKKPLHTLRKSLQTDWLAEYPPMDVCEWLGNSIEVARAHYHRPKPETIARITGQPSVKCTDAPNVDAPKLAPN